MPENITFLQLLWRAVEMRTSYSINLFIVLFTTQWRVTFPWTKSTRSRRRTLTGCRASGSTRRNWRSRGFEVTTTSSAPQPDPERPWRPLTSSTITSEDLGNYNTQSESQLYLEFSKYQVMLDSKMTSFK